MYYEEKMSQQDIADELNISRPKVSRSLKKARKEGIVKITIDYHGTNIEQEKNIKENFDLKDVIIVQNDLEDNASLQVQKTSAQYLNSCIDDNYTISVGWGTTIREVANHMVHSNKEGITFTPIIGGHSSHYSQIHSSNIAQQMALKTNGSSVGLNAPALVSSIEEKKILMNNSSISNVINISSNADIAIFSLGNPIYKSSTIHEVDYFSEENIEKLKNNNAICDFVSISFLDKNGNRVNTDISDNSIGINIEDLLNIPTKICVVNGQNKHISTLAALRAGYIDILITDKETADFLSHNS